MSTEAALEGEKVLPQCGRLVFRGVELAYLNIDGEYMLPLAELLALVLPSTPRTTLFTRMEKMKVRRHFCQPEEIKLLKTVNGIHGSSANCTLLSKTEVDKYCSMYIDNLSESNKGKCIDDIKKESEVASAERREGNCKSKDMESAHQNNNEIADKLAVVHVRKASPRPLKAKLKLAKISNTMKLKSALSCNSQFNETLTDRTSREAIDGGLTYASVNDHREGIIPVSSKLLSSAHASNFSQTQPLRANNKRLKKRDKNLNSEANKKGKFARAKKRLSNDVDKEFESPLKIPKRSEMHERQEEKDKVNETTQFQCGRSSQKQELDYLISDSSSNDSGFASTALSNASTPTKTDFSAGELSGLLRKDEEAIKEHEHVHSSARRPPKLKTPPKNKTGGNKGNSLTLSPPALLLKRYEDSWQVEPKSPVKEVTHCLHKSKVKPKKDARPAGLTSLFEETCGQTQRAQVERKEVRKRRKRRKPLILKEETLVNKDSVDDGEKPDGAKVKQVKKKRAKRKQKGKLSEEGTLSNEQLVSPEKGSDFSTTKEKKPDVLPQEKQSPKTQCNAEQLSKEELAKKNSILDSIVGDALAKFFGSKTTTADVSPSAQSNITSTPPKPKPKKPKVAPTIKPVLKTNSDFKLLNLFPVTSQLSLEDGSLTPLFTMSCPKGEQPPSSHPLWKWRLGGPVVRDTAQKFLKPKPVPKPKKPQSCFTTKLVANKVRKRRRRRNKMSTIKNSPSIKNPLAAGSAMTDSKSDLNKNVPAAATEFKLPAVCAATSSNIVSPSAEMEVG